MRVNMCFSRYFYSKYNQKAVLSASKRLFLFKILRGVKLRK